MTLTDRWTIEIAALSKRYGSAALFRDLTFSIRSGDAIQIVGSNGAGKTQFLLSLAGLKSTDRGNVFFADEAGRRELAAAPRARDRYLRYIPERYTELGELQIAEFVLVLARVLRPFSFASRVTAARTYFSRVVESLETSLGVSLDPNRHVGTLSVGQQKRLAVTAVLTSPAPPAVLLIDEPLAGVDAEGTKAVVDSLLTAQRAGMALLVAEHRPQIHGLRFSRTIQMPYGIQPRSVAERGKSPRSTVPFNPPRTDVRPVLLELSDAVAGYSGAEIHCGLFSLRAGDVVVIRGANGAGKTGFLKALAGSSPARLKGLLQYNGHSAVDLSSAIESGQVSYLHQDDWLFDDLRVQNALKGAAWARNCDVPVELDPMTKGLGHKKLVKNLSSGNKALLAFSECMARHPNLALLDEPTANVDDVNREAIAAFIDFARNKWGTAFIIAEHSHLDVVGTVEYSIEPASPHSPARLRRVS